MTEPTDKALAYQLEAALIPLGAQWEQLEDAVCGRPRCAHALLDAFGEQLAEIVRLARLEVAENERLRSLNTEMREALKEWDAIKFHGPVTQEIVEKTRAILAKTETA